MKALAVAMAGDAIPLGTTMASTSPEIAQQIECNGYALVKGVAACPAIADCR
jgi:hypothetical protein